eukprot:PLAT1616.2.p1 GENE.PLAT1616.2~~PLAT1616.2.p1  ORF type:complete len:511 (-),score=231.12 PLAT1616.2:38-1408(-)
MPAYLWQLGDDVSAAEGRAEAKAEEEVVRKAEEEEEGKEDVVEDDEPAKLEEATVGEEPDSMDGRAAAVLRKAVRSEASLHGAVLASDMNAAALADSGLLAWLRRPAKQLQLLVAAFCKDRQLRLPWKSVEGLLVGIAAERHSVALCQFEQLLVDEAEPGSSLADACERYRSRRRQVELAITDKLAPLCAELVASSPAVAADQFQEALQASAAVPRMEGELPVLARVDLYGGDFTHKFMLSIDIRAANFTVMRLLDERLVLHADSWPALVRRVSASRLVAASRIARQRAFGRLPVTKCIEAMEQRLLLLLARLLAAAFKEEGEQVPDMVQHSLDELLLVLPPARWRQAEQIVQRCLREQLRDGFTAAVLRTSVFRLCPAELPDGTAGFCRYDLYGQFAEWKTVPARHRPAMTAFFFGLRDRLLSDVAYRQRVQETAEHVLRTDSGFAGLLCRRQAV